MSIALNLRSEINSVVSFLRGVAFGRNLGKFLAVWFKTHVLNSRISIFSAGLIICPWCLFPGHSWPLVAFCDRRMLQFFDIVLLG